MALTSLSSPPPIGRKARPPKPDYELLESAIELHNLGKHREAFQRTLQHVFANRPELASNKITFAQGSSRVTVHLGDDDELTIEVPLVKLPPTANTTAAMRFLLTKLAGSGQLHQPRLRGDSVYLEFRDKLSRLHPHKVVESLRRMPVQADTNDDWMVDQFGAEPLDRQPIPPLDEADLDRAESAWRVLWGEVEELVKESQRKRSMFFLNEVTAFAVYQLHHVLPLTGSLSARVSEAARIFNDNDEDPIKREAALTKCAKEMKAISKEELSKSLGHAEYTISPLEEGTAETLTNYLGTGNYIETVAHARTSGKFMEASVALFSTYSYLLARFGWPEEIEKCLEGALAQASNKPWREASGILLAEGKTLAAKFGEAEGEGEEEDEDEDNEAGEGEEESEG
jgi:hypothetical protein